MTIDKLALEFAARAYANNPSGHSGEDGAFRSHATPQAVLALLAEIDRLESDKAYAEAWEKARDLQSEMDEVVAERDTLRAELAGLRTGYDAQNNVIAELKDEGVSLRKALSECLESLAGELAQKYGDQRLESMHPVTRRSYDRDMSELDGYRSAMPKESSHG